MRTTSFGLAGNAALDALVAETATDPALPSRAQPQDELHATWQRCRVHFMRNALAHAGRQGRRVVSAFIATAFVQDDAETARDQWRQVADQLRPRCRSSRDHGQGRADALAFMSLPQRSSAKIHSINPSERLNGEIKRRTDVVGIFPTTAAIITSGRRPSLGTERRMDVQRGRYMTLETIGSFKRRSHRQAARRGRLTIPAIPADERDYPAAPTPPTGDTIVVGRYLSFADVRRSRSYEHKAALYRRWRVRSDVRRQRVAGAAAQRRHSQRRFGVSRVDRAMARRAISPTTKADEACAERDLAGLCPGPAGWAGRRSEWRFCSWPVRKTAGGISRLLKLASR